MLMDQKITIKTPEGRLQPFLENITGLIAEKLDKFGGKLNKQLLDEVLRDYSKQPGYSIEVIDNPRREGIIVSMEKWDNGARSFRQYDERYQIPEEGWDADYGPRPGEFEIGLRIGKETGGRYSYGEIDMSYNYHIRNPKWENSDNPIGNSLTQEITCNTETASSNSLGGGKRLMEGAFFDWAGHGRMEEKTTIYENDGRSSYFRRWEEDKYLGPNDRYQTTRVTDTNGVVEHGAVQHGVALGIHVPMRVVYPPEKK